MRLVCPSDPELCRPLRIADGPGRGTAFIGGRRPTGITPSASTVALRYFATVPLSLEPALAVSLFVADLEPLMEARGRVNETGLLQPIVHAPTAREATSSPLDSDLSEHELQLLEVASDLLLDDEGQQIIRSGHKVGGRPHLVRSPPRLLASIEDLRTNDYFLVAQFDFPSGDDALVSGDWPFADGMFALFGRASLEETDWRWYWDF